MNLALYRSPEEIAAAVKRLAGEINRDYAGLEPLFVGVLNGSYIFIADLTRRLEMPIALDFMRASSYGEGRDSCGQVTITRDLEQDVSGRDVIVVEDIVDTGLTLSCILQHIGERKPASLRVCALLDKPGRRAVDCRPDYVGMEVEDLFLVGYGLDLAGRYRNLAGLYTLADGPDSAA